VTTRRELREAREAAARSRRRDVFGRIGYSSAKATRAARSAGASLASRTGLRERRKQREREETRGLRRIAVALAALAAALLLAWFAVDQLRGSEEAPVVAARTQRVVLLQITAADGAAVGNALLGYDDADGGDAVVLIPAGLTVEGSGAKPVSLAEAAKAGDGSRARAALSKLLGVTIDGALLLDQSAFAALFEQLNGVSVEVPEEVTANGVAIAAGKPRLDGPSATAYATYLGRGESEDARLGRLQAVLEGLVPTLPRSPAAAAALPAALGPGVRSSLPDEQLGAVLAGLAKAGGVRYERLPADASGGGKLTYAIDRDASDALVADLFPNSRTSG
jgi:hypothetical protein